MPIKTEFTINPPRRFPCVNWNELWLFRELFLVLAWRDISVRYKQTALGILWVVLQPFVMMVIFTFVFNKIGKIESGDGTPYPIFLYVGLLIWQYFSVSLSNASNSMVSSASLISKIYFPRLIIPATSAITSLVDLLIASIILSVMMVYYGLVPHLMGLVILPMLILCTVLTAMGVGFFFAALNVKYRDVRYALPFLIQILMYVTPVVYPVKMLDKYPTIKTLILWLNPVAGVISNARAGILGQGPIDWGILGICSIMSVIFFVAGLYYFRNTEYYFADIV